MRRKRLPGSLEGPFRAFLSVVGSIERAKSALTDTVPTTRLPGRPFADALLEFEEGLREARAQMDGWRAEDLERAWTDVRDGLEEALARAERLRLEAPDPGGFEGLIGTIQALLDPLEALAAAAERFRALRA